MQTTLTEEKYTKDYCDFISDSPVARFAAERMSRDLAASGYTELFESQPWPSAPGGYFLRRESAIIAWYVPENLENVSFRVVGSHNDSPTLRLKPIPCAPSHGFTRINIEPYGGLLPNSWFNRDLGLAGSITLTSGEQRLVRTPAIMVIPQLAVHLNRDQAHEVHIDTQKDLAPIWMMGEGDLLTYLAARAGVERDDIAAFDLFAYDTQGPALVGSNKEWVSSGRQDNLSSAYAILAAFCRAKERWESGEAPRDFIPIFASFDHEEVGSSTPTGAAGPLLEAVLRRIVASYVAENGLTPSASTTEDLYWQAIMASESFSVDAGQALNPNFPEKHDPDHHPIPGSGPMAKVNANQRYTSDGRGIASIKRAGAAAGCPVQNFVSNNMMPCGSTIGPISGTRLGIHTVDLGIPLLSMHSIRELAHRSDLFGLTRLLEEYICGA